MAILAFECPHCRRDMIAFQHHACSTFEEAGQRYRNYMHLSCRGCGRPVAIEVANGNGHMLADTTAMPITLEQIGVRIANVWPPVPVPKAPGHLPPSVLRAFLAGEKTFPDDALREASGGSYGRALELGTIEVARDLAGMTLYARIERLAATHRITPDLAAWSHSVRLVRNDAVHDVEGITREELIALRGFTEMVLTYLFTLPAMLAARREANSAQPDPPTQTRRRRSAPHRQA